MEIRDMLRVNNMYMGQIFILCPHKNSQTFKKGLKKFITDTPVEERLFACLDGQRLIINRKGDIQTGKMKNNTARKEIRELWRF